MVTRFKLLGNAMVGFVGPHFICMGMNDSVEWRRRMKSWQGRPSKALGKHAKSAGVSSRNSIILLRFSESLKRKHFRVIMLGNICSRKRETPREKALLLVKILVEEFSWTFYSFRVKVQIVKSYDRTKHFMRNGNINNECNTKIFWSCALLLNSYNFFYLILYNQPSFFR